MLGLFPKKPDPRIKEAVELFNRHLFRDALIIFEEPWKESYGQEERFLRALIKVSGAFHHFEENRLDSALELYNSAIDLLSNYPPEYKNIDVKKLIEEMKPAFEELVEKGTQSEIRLDRTKIPVIRFV